MYMYAVQNSLGSFDDIQISPYRMHKFEFFSCTYNYLKYIRNYIFTKKKKVYYIFFIQIYRKPFQTVENLRIVIKLML